jgi:MFS family permease
MDTTQHATEALDNAHSSRIHKDITTIASLALFLAGLGYFILTLAIPLIGRQWHLSQSMEGLLGSSALFGAIFGALSSGYLTDKLGRRTMLRVSIIGVFIFSAFSAMTWSITSLIIARFWLGVSISSNYPVAASYLAETMAVKNRGRKFCQAMLVNCIGAVAGVIASYLILCVYKNVEAWRFMLALTCIPAVWAFIVSLRIPESPRWLLANNRQDEARTVINKMTTKTVDHDSDIQSDRSTFADLFKAKYIKQTLLVCITWFLMDISYYGIGIFTPTLMQSLHFEKSGDFFTQIMVVSKETVFANIFIVIGAYMAVVLIEKVGRIKLQALGFLWVTIGLLVMCASHLFPGVPIMHLVCILAGFAIFNFFINVGPGATTYLIPAEIYPTNLRGKGHGFATACAKIGAALGIFILPVLQSSVGALTTVLIIAGTTFLGYAMTVYLGFETKGKSLEEIHEVLSKKKDDFVPEVKFDPYMGL